MSLTTFPQWILDSYEVHEWRHASAILKEDFPNELQDLIDVLSDFRLKKSYITTRGGSKSLAAKHIDEFLYGRGWEEKQFSTQVVVDGVAADTPTHKVDCVKNRVAIEIEWNNKDPFYDRDLNNFRLLFDLKAISVGVIITRRSELQDIFNDLDRGTSYGNSTTHMDKLLPRIEGGGAAGCPLLVFGISKRLYRENQ